MGCCGVKSKNDMGKALWCMSLGTFATIFCVIQIILSAYQIWATYNYQSAADNGTIVMGYLYNAVHLFLGVFALVSILLKFAFGLGLIKFVIAFIVMSVVVAAVIRWVVFILNMNGLMTKDGKKFEPQGGDWFEISFTTVVAVIYGFLGWYVMSVFASLVRVIKVGGNGFEGLSYKQITTGTDFNDSDDESV